MYVAQVPATGAVTCKALSALGPWQAEDPPLSERQGLEKADRHKVDHPLRAGPVWGHRRAEHGSPFEPWALGDRMPCSVGIVA